VPPSWSYALDDYPGLYNNVTQDVWSTIDEAAGGTLMSKTKDEAYNLIEEMVLNNFQWSTERA